MEVDLSLSGLFGRVFGTPQSAFNPSFTAILGDSPGKRTVAGKLGAPYYDYTNALGVEMYLPVEINVGTAQMPDTDTTYAEALGVRDSSGVATGKWNLPYPVIKADVNVHIVDTPLTERDGMVSELININGYKIHDTGLPNKSKGK